MAAVRKCSNCKNRVWEGWLWPENCLDYEMAAAEEEEIAAAKDCHMYEEDAFDDEDEYCPSSTRGDYSPSNPWDAPGMSIKDFI